MKKKWILIIVIIIVLFILGIIFRPYINNWIFNIRMMGVNKDIIIEKCDVNITAGGYATISDYYYVDLNKKKMYHVEDYYVYGVTSSVGEAGSHYTLKGIKKLTNDEITEIMHLANLESDYDMDSYNINDSVDKNGLIPFLASPFSYYYRITFNEKTIELNDTTASKLVNIIENM